MEVLQAKSISIDEEVNATKEAISGDDLWKLVESSEKIVVASGKKCIEFSPADDDRSEVVAKISGRTGNLRAPSLRVGEVYYIGYNVEMYRSMLG